VTRPCHLPVKRKDKRLQGRAEVGARRQAPGHSRVTMAVSTQQLAEELQIFGLDYEDSLLEKRESRTERIASKFYMLVWYLLGPD
jgi:hypothetical protein